MLIDADRMESGTGLEADVCVVGAGPAGITLALRLARAGRKVCLLEAGGRSVTRESERLASGESVGHPYFPLESARARAFGGSAHMWAGNNGWFRARPLDPVDFEQRPGVAHSGWPMDFSELEPYYQEANAWCALGEYDYSVERWATPERPALPLPAGGPIVTRVFKLSSDLVWLRMLEEVAATEGLDLVIHANVVELTTKEGGRRVAEVTAMSLAGVLLSVRADRVVLAAGGIENARLLLASSEANPRGLGNEHDLVGRFFMEHPHIRSGVIRPRDPDVLSQLGLYQRHRAGEENVAIHAKLAVDPAVLRERGLLNTTYFVEPMSDSRASAATRSAIALKHAATFRPLPPDIARHLATVVTNAGSIASTAREVLTKKRTRDVAQLMCMAEDAPNPDSRVTLGSRADSTGLPVARLDWRPTEAVRRSVRAAQDLLDEQLRDARLGHVEDKLGDEDPPREIKGAWHHMGTARMDPDPTRGVVDQQCRVHSVDNLYVAGSAVFPTVGYANPTLTIVALALRLADHLADQAA